MDVFSHALWTGAAYKTANGQLRWSLNVRRAAFWGVFPDLFAFTVPALWIGWSLLFGQRDLADYPRPGSGAPPLDDAYWPFQLAHAFYKVSHSAVVFFAVFGIVFFFKWVHLKKPSQVPFLKVPGTVFMAVPWEMGGWLLHILIDIPTHSYKFYPTPIFWPIHDWKFRYGFSWGIPWFLGLNYIAIIIVYWLLWRKKKIVSDDKPTICNET